MTKALEDRLAIYDLIARYTHTLDNKDYAGWIACFTPDGVFVNPDGVGGSEEVGGLLTFTRGYEEARRPFPNVRHVINTVLIELGDDDTAAAHSYLQAFFTDAKGPQLHTTGVYHDKLVKLGGQWLIKERSLEKDVFRPATAAA